MVRPSGAQCGAVAGEEGWQLLSSHTGLWEQLVHGARQTNLEAHMITLHIAPQQRAEQHRKPLLARVLQCRLSVNSRGLPGPSTQHSCFKQGHAA